MKKGDDEDDDPARTSVSQDQHCVLRNCSSRLGIQLSPYIRQVKMRGEEDMDVNMTHVPSRVSHLPVGPSC